MRRLGTLDLIEAQDGTVRAEVVSRKPASDRHAYGRVYRLSEEVAAGYGVLIDTSGIPDHARDSWGDLPRGWRYLGLRAKVEPGPTGRDVTRRLDLSEGSDDRRLVAKLVEQGELRVVWVHEGIEAVREFEDNVRRAWNEALENTRGVDRDAWREEMAELEWRHSPSWRPGRPRPRPYRRRTVAPPHHPVPFFAARSGPIVRDGRPTIAGLRLPPGRRCNPAAYWATESDVDKAAELASTLAAAFSDTGLWPMLWAWESDPDDYLGGLEPGAIGGVDVQEVLREGWESMPPNPAAIAPFGATFPGLAPTSVPQQRPLTAGLPFGVLMSQPADLGPDAGRRLLLVPCNRPADALTVLGYEQTGLDAPQIRAVMRSWEERFQAVPVELEPSTVTLAVRAPPTTLEQALLLAAEHYAVAPPDDGGRPNTVRDLAGVLLDGRAGTDGWRPTLRLSPNLWELAFGE